MAVPRISVVMPVCNAADTVGAAIASIQSQTCRDWEMVMVDDGSTDGTLGILRKVVRSDVRIRLFPIVHSGIVIALQKGVAEARGLLLARMDADDIALPMRLEVQAKVLESRQEAALCGGRVKMIGAAMGMGLRRYAAWIDALVAHEPMARELFVECPLPHPTFMMRRETYDAVGGYQDHGWAEDYDLVMRVWESGGKFIKPEEVVLEWRNRSDRLSMNDARYSPEAFRALKRHYLQRFRPAMVQGEFYQWGAGEVGKKWLREWRVKPLAVVDINPRKIGRKIHDVPVVPPESLPAPGRYFTVVAVGTPGARDEIRGWFNVRGYLETRDYLFVA